jgi:hypothetical protein
MVDNGILIFPTDGEMLIWKVNLGASIAWIFILMNLNSGGYMRSTQQQLGTRKTFEYLFEN